MKRRISLMMVAIYIFSCIIIPVNASSLDTIKKEQKNIKNKISDVKKEKKAIEADLAQIAAEKKQLESDEKKTQGTLKQKSKEISIVNTDIKLINKEIDAIDKDYEYKTELFKTRMRVLYQNMNKSPLESFVEAKSFSEFFSRIELLSLVRENDEKLINEISVAKRNTEDKKQEKLFLLDQKKTQLEKLNGKVSEIKTSRAQAEMDIEARKAELKKAEKSLDDFIAESNQLSKKVAALMDKNTKYAGGVMKWPTAGYTRISSPFGYRIHPIYKVKKMHSGIDIDAPSGATIAAANSGKVILAGWNGGYGNCVIIDHGDGIATLYGHQSKILVSVGDKVGKGDTIGKVGSTGLSTGPHLHFEVRKDGKAINPMPYFT